MKAFLPGLALMLLASALVQAQPSDSDADLQPRVQTSTLLTAKPVTVPTASVPAPAHSAPTPAHERAHDPPDGPTHSADAQGGTRSAADDRLQLGTTEISGNRELPKLMYIVPWRRPLIGPFTGRPPNSLVDEALTPVDRSVFERQNRYYDALKASMAAAGSGKAAPGRGTTDRAGAGAGAHAPRRPALPAPASGGDEK